jgi:hypothetical protein
MKKFIFRIGPLELSGEPNYFYYVYPWENTHSFFIASSNEEGFERILEVYTSDDLECEPELAETGTTYNIASGEITPERAYNIILMGLEALEEEHFKNIERGGLIYQLGGATADFWQCQPWQKAFAKLHLQFNFTGSIDSILYGFVMGKTKHEYGIALYRTYEDLKMMLELARRGSLEEASNIETLGVTLWDEPLYASHAMQRAFGVNRIPIPVVVHDNTRCFASDLDILILAAALEAVAVMNDNMQYATGRVTVEDLEVACRITPKTELE